jgi:glutamyl-tRNA reductase
MNIIIVGLNHKTAPVEVREKLAFSEELLNRALSEMRSCKGIHEGLILSTCNRVEVCAVVQNTQEGYEILQQFLEQIHGERYQSLQASYFYFYETQEAIQHVFRVASSLDSMVVGEPQILGQIKEAFEAAMIHKTTGVILNKLFNKAISVAKRVRTETRIAESPVSVSAAAVDLASRVFGQLEHTTVLLIGSGEMAESAARHLNGQGVKKIRVTGRNYERACELARTFHGKAVFFEGLSPELVEADIVICSTGATQYLITADQMRGIIQIRKNRPIFLIDLSVPRNIEPRVNEIDNVFLYNIDDLQQVVETNMKQRQKEADKAETIVAEEVQTLSKWLKSLEVVPTIIAIRELAEQIRRGETQKVLNKMGELPESARETLDGLTQSIINKLLHTPLMVLKQEASSSSGSLYVETIRKLFNLDLEIPTRSHSKERITDEAILHPKDQKREEGEDDSNR